MASKKDPRLSRAGVSGFNQPKRTPDHPKKSHVVVAKQGEQVKTIRFGQQGVSGSPKTVPAPAVGLTNPKSIRMVVVLPAPFGPTKPQIVPRGTSNEIWSTAFLSP